MVPTLVCSTTSKNLQKRLSTEIIFAIFNSHRNRDYCPLKLLYKSKPPAKLEQRRTKPSNLWDKSTISRNDTENYSLLIIFWGLDYHYEYLKLLAWFLAADVNRWAHNNRKAYDCTNPSPKQVQQQNLFMCLPLTDMKTRQILRLQATR